MFELSAKWHITEASCSYNEWETQEIPDMRSGVDMLCDMFTNPHNWGVSPDGQDWDSDEEPFASELCLRFGLFLVQSGHQSFTGKGETFALPRCKGGVLERPLV